MRREGRRPPGNAAPCWRVGTVLLALGATCFAQGGQAATASGANEPAAAAAAPAEVGAPASPKEQNGAIDYSRDEPPPTPYDRLGEGGRPSLAPESFALVRQLGRTVLALVFTCALIYLFFRLGLPRLVGLWGPASERTLQVRERVPLDGSNQLLRVEADSGEMYLLGVGTAGVQLVEKWPAPPGGPLPGPRRPRSQFAEVLKGMPTDPGNAGDAERKTQ